MKKFLTGFLIASIIFTSLPVVALANNSGQDVTIENATSSETTSGTCGENATWSFDSVNGKLTISGFGAMDEIAPAGWKFRSNIKTAVIEQGITSISMNLFDGCTNLTDVTIPTSVEVIGVHAFRSCFNLEHISIPEGVTTIADLAFYNCNKLKNIDLPVSLQTICTGVFDGCTSLSTVKYAGSYDQWCSVSIDSAGGHNEPLLQAVIITKDSNMSCGENAAASFDEETGTLHVSGTGAINNYDNDNAPWSNLKNDIIKIVIGNGITSIGNNAFLNCTQVKDVTIPKSTISIGESAFEGCSKLTNVNYAGTREEWDNINFGANNGRLTQANITTQGDSGGTSGERIKTSFNEETGVLTISGRGGISEENLLLLDAKDKVTEVIIEKNIRSISGFTFSEFNNLTKITIPESVYQIESYIFGEHTFDDLKNCKIIYMGTDENWKYAVTYIEDDDPIMQLNIVTQDSFYNSVCGTNLTASFDAGTSTLTVSGYGEINTAALPWSNMTDKITKIVIENGITVISEEAFKGCVNLKNISLPMTVKEVKQGAFSDCKRLINVEYPLSDDRWQQISIGAGNEPLTKAKYLNKGSFNDVACGDNSAASFDETTGILTISGSGVIADYNNDSVPWGAVSDKITKIVIENGIAGIGSYAFEDLSNITNVEIPESVITIGENAFNNCNKLAEVNYIGTYEGWKTIAVETGNKKFTEAKIIIQQIIDNIGANKELSVSFDFTKNTLTIGGKGEVIDCENGTAPWQSVSNIINKIIIEDGITGIGNYAFAGFNNLSDVIIPESVKKINQYAFNDCRRLTDIHYAGSIQQFMQISSISEISCTVHCTDGDYYLCGENIYAELSNSKETLTLVGSGNMNKSASPWAYSNSVKNIVIPEGITSISSYAFRNLNNVTDITIPSSVTDIGVGAFGDRVNLSYKGTLQEWTKTYRGGYLSNCIQFDDGNFYMCGNNAYVQFDDAAKTLTISGKGRIANKNYWSAFSDSIEIVIIKEGITEIMPAAFSGCSNLKSVTIADSVANIGYSIFNNCSSLTNVKLPVGLTNIENMVFNKCSNLANITIPGNVTQIGSHAFSDCVNLTSVVIPNNVTNIESLAFNNCSSLTQITIPISVTNIGDNAFSGCSNLPKLTYNGTLQNWMSINGKYVFPGEIHCIDGDFYICGDSTYAVFDSEAGLLTIKGSGETPKNDWNGIEEDIKNVVIEDGITSLEGGFYNCINLISITIPESMVNIAPSAFEGCTSLESMMLPSSLTNLGDRAFKGCQSLTNISLPEGITSIEYETFCDCNNLTSIAIPSSVTNISDSAFLNCSGLVKVIYNGTKEEWNNIVINEGNDLLTQAEIIATDSITEVSCGESATASFDNATGILTIGGNNEIADFSNDIAPWSSVSDEISEVVISEGITAIGDYAFEDCSNLTNVTIPENITNIGDYAFSGCSNLTSVNISENAIAAVNSVPRGKARRAALKDVNSIGVYAFENCSNLTSIIIPNGIEVIGDNAFSGCDSLTSVTIPKSVTSIGNSAFGDCAKLSDVNYLGTEAEWKGITIETGNEPLLRATEKTPDDLQSFNCGSDAIAYFDPSTGVLTIEGSGEISYFDNNFKNVREEVKELIIKEGITSIADYNSIFANCKSLTNVKFPSSLISIGEGAFENCSNLVSIEMPEGVTSIGNWSFGNCKNLANIKLPNSLISIGDGAFENCSSLVGIEIPERVTSIGSWAFGSCKNLINVKLPNSLINIGEGTFESCSALVSIEIPEGVTNIGGWAFESCGKLINVKLPNSLRSIGEGAFESCNALVSIEIPEGVTSIGSWAFDGCNLANISLPVSLERIYDNAFIYCNDITSVKYIGSKEDLDNMSIGIGNDYLVSKMNITPKSFTDVSCGENAKASFNSSTGMLTISGSGEMNVNDMAPWGKVADNIKKIVIDEGITSIDEWAFYDCDNLTEVTLPNSLIYIKADAFSNCDNLKNITIPANVKSIGMSAFSNCSTLTSVTISEGVVNIGEWAFGLCKNMTNISLPKSLEKIYDEAFYCCEKLSYVGYNGTEAEWNDITIGTGNKCLLAVKEVIPESFSGLSCWENEAIASFDIATGILVIRDNSITGTYDYDENGSISPWGKAEENIKSVVIEEGVRWVDDYSFGHCVELTNIYLPKSIKSIWYGAFMNCDKLSTVEYAGSDEEWSKITIEEKNEPLLNAVKHYNSMLGNKVSISGQIADGTDTDIYTVKLIKGGNIVAVTTGSTEYTFNNIYAGDYRIEVYKDDKLVARYYVSVKGSDIVQDITPGELGMKGDVNNDKKVNILDVTRLLNHVNKSDVIQDDSACDINGDGRINILDVTRLLNSVNKSDPLE